MVIRNTAWNLLTLALATVANFLMVGLLGARAGLPGLGLFMLVQAFVGNLTLAESGLGVAASQAIGEVRGTGRGAGDAEVREIASTHLILGAAQALLVCLILLGLRLALWDVLFPRAEYRSAVVDTLFAILLGAAFLQLLTTTVGRVFEGLERYDVVRSAQMLKWLVLIAVAVIMPRRDDAYLTGLAWGWVAAEAATLGVLLWRLRRARLGLTARAIRWRRARALLRFSAQMWLAKLFALLSYRVDTIVVGHFLPPQQLAFYAIVARFSALLRTLFGVLSSAVVPAAARFHGRQDVGAQQRLFLRGTFYVVAGTLPLAVWIAVAGADLVRLWLGQVYPEVVPGIWIAMGVAAVIAPVGVGADMMAGIARLRPLLVVNGVATVLNVVVSIVSTPRIGYTGVLWGSLLGALVIALGYGAVQGAAFGTSPRILFRDVLLPPLPGLAWVALVSLLAAGHPAAAAAWIIGFAGYAGWLYLLVPGQERREWLSHLRPAK